MRAVARRSLSVTAMSTLLELATEVSHASDPKARAAALWKRKPRAVFAEIRAVLKAMAGGRERCMYCEDSEGTDIEHFWPKSKHPDRAFSWPNYLLACSHCNSNHKRAKFPMTGGVPELLDPTTDEPRQHLRLLPIDGKYTAIGPKGAPSIEVFDLNGDEHGRKLAQGRRDTFVKLQVLLLAYAEHVERGDDDMAHQIKRSIINEPFPAVLGFLLDLARQPGAALVLRPGIVQVIQNHRVMDW